MVCHCGSPLYFSKVSSTPKLVGHWLSSFVKSLSFAHCLNGFLSFPYILVGILSFQFYFSIAVCFQHYFVLVTGVWHSR